MGESFDLTFFSNYSGCKLSELYPLQTLLGVKSNQLTHSKKHKFSFLTDKDLYFTSFFCGDYNEYELGVGDVNFVRETLQEDVLPILELVNEIFCCCTSIVFATGVYEITDLLIKDITCFQDFFNRGVLADFPLLFFRKDNPIETNITGEYCNICYCIHEGPRVQDIF